MQFLQWLRRKLSRGNNLGQSGSNVYPLIYEAWTQLQLQQYDKAREVLLRALKFRDDIMDPAVIDYLLTSLGSTWIFTEKYAEGISFFSECIGRYPQDSAAYRERATALWYAGQLQEAIHNYTRALKLKSNDIISLSGRGQLLAEIGQCKKALEDLDVALQELKTPPMSGPGWKKWYGDIEAFVRNGRGVALAGLGEEVSAMREFDLSITMCPENAWVYYNRACVHDAAGNREKAYSDYQTALAKNGPALNPIRKERAQARLREIANQP